MNLNIFRGVPQQRSGVSLPHYITHCAFWWQCGCAMYRRSVFVLVRLFVYACSIHTPLPVLLFSKFKLFFRYFDPENIFIGNETKYFSPTTKRSFFAALQTTLCIFVAVRLCIVQQKCLCFCTPVSKHTPTPVLLLSKFNKLFFGYFDPQNIFLDNEN